MRELFQLDPAVQFLNHGSFGALPRAVRQEQDRIRDEMERQPVAFFVQKLEHRLDEARSALAAFVRAPAEDLVFVPNATTGLNAVLRSLSFSPGEELVTTDHEYNASKNALDFIAERAGAKVVVAHVPFPIASEDECLAPVLAALTPRTRLVLVDHVTSITGMIFPVARLAQELARRGIDLLVDGAHAPGQLDLDLSALGAAYYTGNCHKWMCTPKGSAFLYVRRDLQSRVRPTSISHGANSPRKDRSRFLLEFDWTGTNDPSSYLTIPFALRYLGGLVDGGWPGLRARNHALVLEGRDILCEALAIAKPVPDSMLASMASVPLPPPRPGEHEAALSPLHSDPLHDELLARHGIEVLILPWPKPPHRVLRISAQVYNHRDEYQALARALKELT